MKINFKNPKKIGIILGVVLFLMLAIGVTYATVAWRTTDYNVTLNSKCLIQGNFTKSENISGEDLLLVDPSSDSYNQITIKEGMVLSNFSVWKNTSSSCDINGYLRIALNITNLPNAYKSNGNSTNALRYALFYYDPNNYPSVTSSDLDNEVFTTLTKGYIYDNGTKDIYYDTIPTNGTKRNYILAIYLDGNLVNNDVNDTTFTASVEASIDQLVGNMPVVESTSAPNLYTDFTYILGTDTSSVNTYTSAYTTTMGSSPTTTLAQDEILLTSYIGSDTLVNVPNKYTINGVEYKVVLSPYINDNYGTFTNNTSITSVYLKDGIEVFSNNMSGIFSGCTSLTSAPTIPNSVTNISSIFSGCTSLTSLDLSNIDLANITTYNNAFNGVSTSTPITVYDCTQYRLFRTMFGSTYTGLTVTNPSFSCYYQRVEYIQSSGTQFIDTEFVPNQNTSIELHFNALVSTGKQDYFGTSTSSNGYSYGFYDGGTKVYDNYNDDIAAYNGHISGEMVVIKQEKATTVTGNYNFSCTHNSAIFTSAHSLYLFARWKSTGAYRPATMNCYYFKIWDNGTLVRNFIPCYSLTTVTNVNGVQCSSGTIGLYDLVNNEFYTNGNTAANAEPFTKGPDVNS